MAFNTKLKIEDIILHRDLQAPDRRDPEHIEDMREAIRRKEKLPRIRVMQVEGAGHFLTDGHHTLEAHKLEEKTLIEAEVFTGTWEDALEAAATANQKHLGLKRTHATKEWATKLALLVHADWTDSRLAKLVGVSDKTVAKMRPLVKGADAPTHRVSATGKMVPAAIKSPRVKLGETNGKVETPNAEKLFDWKQFDAHFGWLIRAVPALVSMNGDKAGGKKADLTLKAFFRITKKWRPKEETK